MRGDPNNDLFLSAATIWEIAIKVGLKKLSLSMPYGLMTTPGSSGKISVTEMTL